MNNILTTLLLWLHSPDWVVDTWLDFLALRCKFLKHDYGEMGMICKHCSIMPHMVEAQKLYKSLSKKNKAEWSRLKKEQEHDDIR